RNRQASQPRQGRTYRRRARPRRNREGTQHLAVLPRPSSGNVRRVGKTIDPCHRSGGRKPAVFETIVESGLPPAATDNANKRTPHGRALQTGEIQSVGTHSRGALSG